MFEPSTLLWALATIGGFIILGLAIAYGMSRAARRSRGERAARDAGTRQVYRESESDN